MELVTPSASRTHASATSSGEYPSPSAATQTADTIFALRGFKYGSIKEEKCGLAPRESDGMPFRYFPVKTPRPNGDQTKKPTFSALAALSTSDSIDRLSNEYSFWVEMIGALLKVGFVK